MLPHLDAAYRFARWLSRAAPGDADDIVQEAVLRAFRGLDAFRGGDAKPWLLTIVRNCHLTALQQRQRRGYVSLAEEQDDRDRSHLVATGPDPEASSMLRDEQRTLERLIGALPAEQREILVLREVEEMAYREIAAITDLPIGTVMSRLARARAALRTLWLQDSEGEVHALR